MKQRWILTVIACGLLGAGAARAQEGVSPHDKVDRRVERSVIREPGPGSMPGMAHRMAMGWHARMAGPGLHHRAGAWGPGMMEALSLTDEQRTKLRDIRDRQARRGIQARADLSIGKLDLHRLMSADKPEAGPINAQIDKLARMRAELAKSRVATLLEMRAVLTPEQQGKLRDLRLHGLPGAPRHGGPGGPDGDGEDEGGDEQGDID